MGVPYVPSGESEDIVARCQALRQQWGAVKSDKLFGALQKFSGVEPDASTCGPGGGGGPDLSSALSLLQDTASMPDLETFKQQRLSGYRPFDDAASPSASRWRNAEGHIGGGAAQVGDPPNVFAQGAADPPRPWAHAGGLEGAAGQIRFGGSCASACRGGDVAPQAAHAQGPGELQEVRGRLLEAESALEERGARAEQLLSTSQELLALVRGLLDRPPHPGEPLSQWQQDVVQRAEQAIRQAQLGGGGPGVRPPAAAGTLDFAADRAGWPSQDRAAAGTSPWRPTSPCAGAAPPGALRAASPSPARLGGPWAATGPLDQSGGRSLSPAPAARSVSPAGHLSWGRR